MSRPMQYCLAAENVLPCSASELRDQNASLTKGKGDVLQHDMVKRQHSITVSYKGPGPDMGWMNATDIGMAIVGVGEMISGASKVAYGTVREWRQMFVPISSMRRLK